MNRQRTSATILTGAAVALALSLGTAGAQAATPEPAEGSTTWSIEPAAAEGPNGRVSLRHSIDPGASVSDFVTVTNFSAQPATFDVYAGDGTVSDSGDFDLLPSDDTPVDGGSWIRIDPVEGSAARPGGGQVVEIAAGAAVTLPVIIDVPADASPGDHPAGIVAELVRGDGDAVQMTSRVGVRVHLRVTGDVVATVNAADVSVAWQPSWNPFAPGVVAVNYALVNEGNVRLGADARVAVEGAFGIGATGATASVREILPGRRAVAQIDLTAWPLVFGWGEITVTPTVVGEDDVAVSTDASSTSFTVWTIPWAQLALIALLALTFIIVRRLRRRSRASVQARIDAAVASAVAIAPDADAAQSEDAGRPVESRATSSGRS